MHPLQVAALPHQAPAGIRPHKVVLAACDCICAAASAAAKMVRALAAGLAGCQQVADASVRKFHKEAVFQCLLQTDFLHLGEEILLRSGCDGHAGQQPAIRRDVTR